MGKKPNHPTNVFTPDKQRGTNSFIALASNNDSVQTQTEENQPEEDFLLNTSITTDTNTVNNNQHEVSVNSNIKMEESTTEASGKDTDLAKAQPPTCLESCQNIDFRTCEGLAED